MSKREELLRLLHGRSRLDQPVMAAMLGLTEEELQAEIKTLEDSGIIIGYSALIDWDQTEYQSVKAMIEVKLTTQRDQGFGRIAKRIYSYVEVQDCYLVSGDYDLMVIVVSSDLQSVARFVSDKIATQDGVISTRTHFILQNYKMNGIAFDQEEKDRRETIIL